MEMNNNRFFTVETEARRLFYQVPKQFMLKNSKYYKMTSDSKLLYGILADRNSLSIKNNWIDKENRIYFIATIESLMEITGWGNQKTIKHLKELRKFNLLISKQRGQGKPSLHYLLQIEVEENLENKPEIKECENDISTNLHSTSLEILKSHSNNTNINNTDINKNELREEKEKEDKVIIPKEAKDLFNLQCFLRLKKERCLYNLDFTKQDLYNILLNSILAALEKDNVSFITSNQYLYFIKTLNLQLKQYNLKKQKDSEFEKKLLGI